MLSGFQCGREYLKTAVRLAILCESCREADYDRRWNLACSYVSKASECIPENELAKLTPFESNMLKTGKPSVPQFSFFEVTAGGNEESSFRNVSSSVRSNVSKVTPSFEKLQKQIADLEKENDQLGKYKELSEKLKCDYIELEKSQASFQNRVREEQSELQLEMKKMLCEIEIIPGLKRDVNEMESEMFRMRDRIRQICVKHREEMTNLYTEMDTSNIERELLAINLHQTQQQLITLRVEKKSLEDQTQQQFTALEVEKKILEDQIHHYQKAFEILSPHLDDNQRLLLSELYADS